MKTRRCKPFGAEILLLLFTAALQLPIICVDRSEGTLGLALNCLSKGPELLIGSLVLCGMVRNPKWQQSS